MNNSLVVAEQVMARLNISLGSLLLALSPACLAQTNVLRHVDMHRITEKTTIVDTRERSGCEQRSLAGALCLPATDLMGNRGQLPNFADIFWALGTAGLDGSETVLVVGNDAAERDFVAGVLYLCGQARIEVLDASVSSVLLSGRYRAGQGIPRKMLRQRIYRASMRDSALILPAELRRLERQRSRVNLVEATNYNSAGLASDKDKPAAKPGAKHAGLDVLYAATPSDAIAAFARLLSIGNRTPENLKVVPVGIRLRRGSRGQDFSRRRAFINTGQSITRVTGVKQWN